MFGSSWFQSGGYRPSGKCDWFKLLTVALPLSLVGACVLSFVLCKLFVWGVYWIGIVPIFAGLLLGLEATRLLRFAHCRNPYVAAGCGILLGSVMYLGYYHCDFVSRAGPRFTTRIDFLPEFINFRMHTDVVHDTHEIGNQKKEPNVYANWFFFALDWVAGALTCGTIAFAGARRAYCETCSRWMLSKKAIAAAGFAGKVAAAISAKQIAALPVLPAVQKKKGLQVAQFELEYCPGNKDQADVCPIYLTAREMIPGNNKSVTVASQIPLTVDELAELAQKLSFQ